MRLYPEEVEMYRKRIAKRREEERDWQLFCAVQAARAPHSKDHGDDLIKHLLSKYKTLDEQDDVTKESIKRQLAIARRALKR